jgi:hypothetical protein
MLLKKYIKIIILKAVKRETSNRGRNFFVLIYKQKIILLIIVVIKEVINMLKKALIKYEILEFIENKEKTETEIVENFSRYFEPVDIKKSLENLVEENEVILKDGNYKKK